MLQNYHTYILQVPMKMDQHTKNYMLFYKSYKSYIHYQMKKMQKVPTWYWSLEGLGPRYPKPRAASAPWARARPWLAGWALLQDERPQLSTKRSWQE